MKAKRSGKRVKEHKVAQDFKKLVGKEKKKVKIVKRIK